MGDNIDPLKTESPLPPQVSEKRLIVLMAVLVVAGTAAGTIFVGGRAGGGVLLGGIMSFVNFYWQRQSTRALFEIAASGQKPSLLAVRYIARYVAIGLFVGFFYVTNALPVAAVILGLSAFAFSVVVEGMIGIFTSSFKKEF